MNELGQMSPPATSRLTNGEEVSVRAKGDIGKWIRAGVITAALAGGGVTGYKGLENVGAELRGLREDVQSAQKGQLDLKDAMIDLRYGIAELKRETSMAADGRLRLLIVEIVRSLVKPEAIQR